MAAAAKRLQTKCQLFPKKGLTIIRAYDSIASVRDEGTQSKAASRGSRPARAPERGGAGSKAKWNLLRPGGQGEGVSSMGKGYCLNLV
jgi:hypothetical protein